MNYNKIIKLSIKAEQLGGLMMEFYRQIGSGLIPGESQAELYLRIEDIKKDLARTEKAIRGETWGKKAHYHSCSSLLFYLRQFRQ